jgi:16S rRNA (guanine527-N7)-methyltransferase
MGEASGDPGNRGARYGASEPGPEVAHEPVPRAPAAGPEAGHHVAFEGAGHAGAGSRPATWRVAGMTPPPMPAVARAVFGDASAKAERYAELLAGVAVERGVLGPNEVPRLWERHLLNSAAIAELVPGPCSLVDLGSGAGLPGIVLALLLPDTEVILLEPALRRATFLEEVVAELALGHTRVVRARAEQMAGTLAADVVTARAVAPLDRLAAWALGLLKPGGIVLAVKGAKAWGEVRDAEAALRRLGVLDVEVLVAGGGKVDPAATVVRLTARR